MEVFKKNFFSSYSSYLELWHNTVISKSVYLTYKRTPLSKLFGLVYFPKQGVWFDFIEIPVFNAV